MKLVILDAYAANPGDISWDPWQELGMEVVRYDRTSPAETVARCQGAEMVLTNKVIISAEVMSQLPDLRYVGVLATGYNVVDIPEATRRGIVVTNIPAYSTMSVAQMVMAHILNIVTPVNYHSQTVHVGRWEKNPDFTYWDKPLIELDGLTLGIVGVGNTGKATARIAQTFGMKVVAFSSKNEHELAKLGIYKAPSLAALFRESDILSLHCPLTPDTHHLVNKSRLRLMKPTAIIINTGRGPLVDEQALADALNKKQIYAAGVDVLTEEPPRNGSPLINARNCFITPHIAWASAAARKRLMQIALDNVKAFVAGAPVNVVNK